MQEFDFNRQPKPSDNTINRSIKIGLQIRNSQLITRKHQNSVVAFHIGSPIILENVVDQENPRTSLIYARYIYFQLFWKYFHINHTSNMLKAFRKKMNTEDQHSVKLQLQAQSQNQCDCRTSQTPRNRLNIFSNAHSHKHLSSRKHHLLSRNRKTSQFKNINEDSRAK